MPTRHAKVGAQGASPQPRLSRLGPGKCVHCSPPLCLLEGAGGSGLRQGGGWALGGGPFLSSRDRDSFSHVLAWPRPAEGVSLWERLPGPLLFRRPGALWE